MRREEVVNSMSLQDAIQVLKDTNCYGTMDIAKTVILKAIEQEPCDDAISRQEAINVVVCDILSSAIVYGRTEEGIAARKAIVEGLKRLPPVTPAEKQESCISVGRHKMTGKEILEILTILKEQAEKTAGNKMSDISYTIIADVKPSSFLFGIDEAIKYIVKEEQAE